MTEPAPQGSSEAPLRISGANAAGMNAPPRRYGPDESAKPEPLRVTVIDFDMSFGHLVAFFIKAALAAIPAAIVLALLGVLALAVFAELGRSGTFR